MGTAAQDFDVTRSEDATDFTDHNLRSYDVVVFLNTDGEGILNEDTADAFERWTQSGGGAVRIHADANADKAWDWKRDMMGGGLFNNRPPIQEATVEVADATHPATAALPASFQWSDEWYNFDADPRDQVHVLLTVDESTYEGGEHGPGHPIAWCSNYDGGRNFYTAIGHADGGATLAWSDQRYLDHIFGALEWAAGEAPGDCGPARAGLPTEASLVKVTLDDETENPMELEIANDGRVFFVEIGAGALDSFNSAVKMYDPATDETYVVGEIPSTAARRTASWGSRWTRTSTRTASSTSSTAVPGPPLSRAPSASPVSPSTPPRRGRHARPGLGGACSTSRTSDSSAATPPARSPSAPTATCNSTRATTRRPSRPTVTRAIDACGRELRARRRRRRATHEHLPADAQHAYDARRTSGNSNDLRGKLIRIDPIESAQPAPRPASARPTTIPDGNLFPVGTADTRPEIYAMGIRNPFRLTVDPETGRLYFGEVGPDANADGATRGPRGYDKINQVRSAGNYGWPYCLGGQGYYHTSTTAPRTGTSGECPVRLRGRPTNDSPHNTGIDTLPPVTDPLIWYPYGSSPEFPEIPPGGCPDGDGRPRLPLRPRARLRRQALRVLRRQALLGRVVAKPDAGDARLQRRLRHHRGVHAQRGLGPPPRHRGRPRRRALHHRVGQQLQLRGRGHQPRLGALPDRAAHRGPAGAGRRQGQIRPPAPRRWRSSSPASSRTAAPRTRRPTSGTSATARPRPRSTRPTPMRGGHLRGHPDRHRRRRERPPTR